MNDRKSFIDSIIIDIKNTLAGGQFIDNENSIVELKDLSTGDKWNSLNETVCAYLNTNGGYIICGIRERDKTYSFTGFDRNNESKLIDLQTKFFKKRKPFYVHVAKCIK